MFAAPPGAKPFEPFRERLECSEGGNTGRRTIGPAAWHRPSSRPFSSQPGSSGSAGYTESRRKGKAVRNGAGAPAAPRSAWQGGCRGVLRPDLIKGRECPSLSYVRAKG